MCDYSLEHIQSREAKVGDRLISTNFPNTLTRGFASPDDLLTAVCLRPGTELAFEEGKVTTDHALGFFPQKVIEASQATFRQFNLDFPHQHHDGLEFADGRKVVLARLIPGQIATVLQLPVSEKVEAETVVEAQGVAEPVA